MYSLFFGYLEKGYFRVFVCFFNVNIRGCPGGLVPKDVSRVVALPELATQLYSHRREVRIYCFIAVEPLVLAVLNERFPPPPPVIFLIDFSEINSTSAIFICRIHFRYVIFFFLFFPVLY